MPEPRENEPLPPHFPFCSDRCRLVDLNRWFTGRYQIPVIDRPHRGEDEPELPSR
jgi:endogenous inhibitor of DNA gyrase (YacG/DUF329 family)